MDTCLTYDELVIKLESLQQENQILQKKLKQNAESNSVLVHESLTEPEFAEVKYREEILTALRQSDERYQNLIEYAPFPLVIAKNGFIEFVNNSAYILLGANNQSDLIGKSVFQFIHPESKSALLKNIHLTLRENHFSLPEEKIIRLDGETRLVQLSAVQYHEKNSTSLYIYLKDITETKKSEKYKEALIEIEKIIHNSLNQQEIIEKTMHRAAVVTECDSAAVSFYQDKKWVVKYVHGFEDSVIGLTLEEDQEPHALLAIKTKAPVVVDDASSDSRVNKEWLKQWGIASVLVVPLFTRYKKIGVIFFNYYRHKNISAEKIKFLGSLSSSLSLALENSALYENVLKELAIRKQKESELDKANLSLKALSKSSQAMVYAQDELAYAKQVCNIVVEDFGYSMVIINYLEKDSSKTVCPFAWSGLDDTYVKNLKLSWGDGSEGQGPTGKAVRSRKPVVCNNIFKDPSYEPWLEEGLKRGYQSCIAIPLIAERHVFGTLNIYSADLDSFNARQVKFLSELAKDLSYGVSTIRLREAGKLTLKALTESEEKFRMLTEKSNALICELDLEGRILYANSKFSEHLGYDPKELEGHPISENCMPEMQQIFFDSIVHFFPNPAFKNEWYLKDKKGLWHWFRCHTSAFVNAKGEERRSVILFEISDIKQVEEQLKRYTRELKELNATKDKFFGIIAHDLKNPFTSLLGASELLINSLENFDHETVKHIGMLLYDSAKRGYTLLQNLLEWSRSQSGTITYNPKAISLKQVVLENISSIQISAFNKKQQIICDISQEFIITADQNMLNTILRNLLQNAIKFTNDGGKIVLKAQKDDHDITISVKDSGVGIAEEDVKKLFRLDEKFTNHGTRNEQGTGLGLILCKEFVEKHKGRIWVESKVGKGSKFSFTIPQTL